MDMSSGGTTVLCTIEKHTATLTLHGPQVRNTLTHAVVLELLASLRRLRIESEVRVIVLAGLPGWFCSGMDLNELTKVVAREPYLTVSQWLEPYATLLHELTAQPQIVITRIDGYAAGGALGLIAASDLAVASSLSSFALPEVVWGLMPATAAPYLIRRMGFRETRRLALLGNSIDASQALSMGLIDAIDPDADDFVRRVVSRARLLPAGSVAQVKRYFQDLAPITQLTRHQGLAELTSALLSPAFAAAACP